MNKYWMVQVVDGGTPTTKYHSHQAAVDRAKQLARTTRSSVVILEAVQLMTIKIVEESTLSLEPI